MGTPDGFIFMTKAKYKEFAKIVTVCLKFLVVDKTFALYRDNSRNSDEQPLDLSCPKRKPKGNTRFYCSRFFLPKADASQSLA